MGHSNNKRGGELLDYITQEGLELHNKGKQCTCESPVGKSVIDRTLSEFENRAKNWKIELNHSGHNTIKYTLETELEIRP